MTKNDTNGDDDDDTVGDNDDSSGGAKSQRSPKRRPQLTAIAPGAVSIEGASLSSPATPTDAASTRRSQGA